MSSWQKDSTLCERHDTCKCETKQSYLPKKTLNGTVPQSCNPCRAGFGGRQSCLLYKIILQGQPNLSCAKHPARPRFKNLFFFSITESYFHFIHTIASYISHSSTTSCIHINPHTNLHLNHCNLLYPTAKHTQTVPTCLGLDARTFPTARGQCVMFLTDAYKTQRPKKASLATPQNPL